VARGSFTLLYVVVLSLSLGAVALLKRAQGPSLPDVVAEVAVELMMAVPPKPEGVEALGEGESPGYTEEGCRRSPGPLREACFHTLALQRAERDPEGALLACAEVKTEALHWECVADVAELRSPIDRPGSEALCETIPPKKWHDQCIFGLAMANVRLAPPYARAQCERAGMWRDFCRHDVNGEIAQVDPEGALAFCLQESGTALQNRGCFHGLGKYLGRTDPDLALAICARAPTHEPLYPQNCLHGLGWAVAETSQDAALTLCAKRGGAYADSCLMGVSANAKRFDPGEALRLCGGVKDEALREKCERFARR
jgi:hypothetical protein